MCVQGLSILLLQFSHLSLLCSMVTILNYLCTPQWGSLSFPLCLPTCLFIALPIQLVNTEPSQCLSCPLSFSFFFFPPRGSNSPSFSRVHFFVPISMSASILPWQYSTHLTKWINWWVSVTLCSKFVSFHKHISLPPAILGVYFEDEWKRVVLP